MYEFRVCVRGACTCEIYITKLVADNFIYVLEGERLEDNIRVS